MAPFQRRAEFRDVKVIGQGSFGRAVLVRCVADERFYVLKEIQVREMSDKEQRAALNEVEVLQMLKHPNIIATHGSFVEDGVLHIVMDYADGGDMHQQIKKAQGVHFPEPLILDWFMQIALALKHVHDKNILHRDLKAQNIFVTRRNLIKLGDFGIAKVLNSDTELARTVIGTPYYLSPELCEDKPYDKKSDIWALGCVLYELVTLRHAFDGQSLPSLVVKILRGKYPPIPSTYSRDLAVLIDNMLQQNPASRPTIANVIQRPFIQERIRRFVQETQQAQRQHMLAPAVVSPETPLLSERELEEFERRKADARHDRERVDRNWLDRNAAEVDRILHQLRRPHGAARAGPGGAAAGAAAGEPVCVQVDLGDELHDDDLVQVRAVAVRPNPSPAAHAAAHPTPAQLAKMRPANAAALDEFVARKKLAEQQKRAVKERRQVVAAEERERQRERALYLQQQSARRKQEKLAAKEHELHFKQQLRKIQPRIKVAKPREGAASGDALGDTAVRASPADSDADDDDNDDDDDDDGGDGNDDDGNDDGGDGDDGVNDDDGDGGDGRDGNESSAVGGSGEGSGGRDGRDAAGGRAAGASRPAVSPSGVQVKASVVTRGAAAAGSRAPAGSDSGASSATSSASKADAEAKRAEREKKRRELHDFILRSKQRKAPAAAPGVPVELVLGPFQKRLFESEEAAAVQGARAAARPSEANGSGSGGSGSRQERAEGVLQLSPREPEASAMVRARLPSGAARSAGASLQSTSIQRSSSSLSSGGAEVRRSSSGLRAPASAGAGYGDGDEMVVRVSRQAGVPAAAAAAAGGGGALGGTAVRLSADEVELSRRVDEIASQTTEAERRLASQRVQELLALQRAKQQQLATLQSERRRMGQSGVLGSAAYSVGGPAAAAAAAAAGAGARDRSHSESDVLELLGEHGRASQRQQQQQQQRLIYEPPRDVPLGRAASQSDAGLLQLAADGAARASPRSSISNQLLAEFSPAEVETARNEWSARDSRDVNDVLQELSGVMLAEGERGVRSAAASESQQQQGVPSNDAPTDAGDAPLRPPSRPAPPLPSAVPQQRQDARATDSTVIRAAPGGVLVESPSLGGSGRDERLSIRVEQLRARIGELLNDDMELFRRIYDNCKQGVEGDESVVELTRRVGGQFRQVMRYVNQLVYCEEAFYGS